MLKVGMVDHHLNNWHADSFLKLLRGPLADEEVEVVAAWESDPVGDDWCAKNSVRRAETIQDAVKDADAVLLLAPDNIDAHPSLAESVLPFGKPTFIDKFLAPQLDQARQIVDLAAKHNAPIFSASALRYSVEMASLVSQYEAERPVAGRFTGMGTWKIYGVHTITMALRVFGPGVKRVINTGSEIANTVTLDYGNGRCAVADVREAANGYEAIGWEFTARVGENYVGAKVVDHEGFYLNLMRETCSFLKTGKSDMAIEEALATVAVLEAASVSRLQGGVWVSL